MKPEDFTNLTVLFQSWCKQIGRVKKDDRDSCSSNTVPDKHARESNMDDATPLLLFHFRLLIYD